jgi:hypothetical protein
VQPYERERAVVASARGNLVGLNGEGFAQLDFYDADRLEIGRRLRSPITRA